MSNQIVNGQTAPPFSIVVVNFNYAAFLPQAIESALGQTIAGCEVIVVDDCSTDGSRDVIGGFGDSVRTVFRSVNGGMSAAVNSGFALARGPVVLFLDADDFLYPDAAARILAVARFGVAQIQGRLNLVDVHGTVEDVFPPYEVGLDSGDVTAKLATHGRYSTTVTSGLAFTRVALDRIMPIPEQAFDRSADGYLAAVAPFYGTIAAIDAPIGAYRRHDSNHSGFGANIAKRARWRVEHDEHRYAAIRDHATRTGVVVADRPGIGDATHLEQRLASLCFSPESHAYADDSRRKLGMAGARAAFGSPMSLKRRAIHAGMFLTAGLAPLAIARPALAWKLERSSRPAVIDWMAGRLRRLLG